MCTFHNLLLSCDVHVLLVVLKLFIHLWGDDQLLTLPFLGRKWHWICRNMRSCCCLWFKPDIFSSLELSCSKFISRKYFWRLNWIFLTWCMCLEYHSSCVCLSISTFFRCYECLYFVFAVQSWNYKPRRKSQKLPQKKRDFLHLLNR